MATETKKLGKGRGNWLLLSAKLAERATTGRTESSCPESSRPDTALPFVAEESTPAVLTGSQGGYSGSP